MQFGISILPHWFWHQARKEASSSGTHTGFGADGLAGHAARRKEFKVSCVAAVCHLVRVMMPVSWFTSTRCLLSSVSGVAAWTSMKCVAVARAFAVSLSFGSECPEAPQIFRLSRCCHRMRPCVSTGGWLLWTRAALFDEQGLPHTNRLAFHFSAM